MDRAPALFLRSQLLPARHGFSTREGGVSKGPQEGAAEVEQNFRQLASLAGLPVGAFRLVSQVHGDRILEAEGKKVPSPLPLLLGEADGLWTSQPGLAVGVRTADCVPLLLSDPEGRLVAAVHSGWKGSLLEIAARAVERLASRGAAPEQLFAAVGPHIRACCYQVDEALARRFFDRFGAEAAPRRGEGSFVDLGLCVRRSLERAGLRPERVDLLPNCTACDARRFFSHRRDRGLTGRQLSFVVAGQGPAAPSP